MKKKFLLVATGSLSMALAISTIAFIANKNKKDNFAKGGPSPVGFDVDFSSVEASGDDYTLLMRDSKGSTISVTVVGANYDSENERFVSKGAGKDFYFYNTDPIRGVSTSSFIMNQPNKVRCDMVALVSSNSIDLDQVLNGYATQDLLYFYSPNEFSGDYNMSMSAASMPYLANYRYFLVDLNSYDEVYLTSMHIESVCDEEVPEQPIVERKGIISSEDEAKIDTMFAGSLQMESVGHQTWCWAYSGDHMFETYKHGATSGFVTAILNSGFVNTANLMGYEIYQKKVGTTVHSILTAVTEGQYIDTIDIFYADYLDYFVIETSWPSAYLEEILTTEHAAAIPDFESEYISEYSCTSHAEGQQREVAMYATLVEDVTEEQIATILTAFAAPYDESEDWTLNVDDSDETTKVYDYKDDFLQIGASIFGGGVTFMLSEVRPTLVAPTAAEIAAQMNISEYIDQIVALNGGEGASYTTNFVEEPSESKNSCSYSIINAQTGSYENFTTILAAAGYSVYSVGENYYEFRKEVDMFGSYVRVSVQRSEKCLDVSYEYQKNYTQFNSLLLALRSVYSISNLNEVCDAFEYQSNYEYYRAYDKQAYVFIKNAGSEFTSQFASHSNLTYIPAYDAYRIDDLDRCLSYEIVEGGVIVRLTYHSRFNFSGFAVYNDVLNQYIQDDGLSLEDNAIYFDDGDNLNVSFVCEDYSRAYYYGSLTELNRVRELYANKILENTDFAYSEYQNLYVNTVTGFAYGMTIDDGSKENDPRLEFTFYTGVTHYDFQSFNDLHMSESVILSEFPALIDDSRKGEKLFADFSTFVMEAHVSVKKDNTVSSYKETLLANGFTASDSMTYRKFIGAYVYTVTINTNDNYYYLNFSKQGPYQNASDFRASLETENLEYLDSIGFADTFISESPTYFVNGTRDRGIDMNVVNSDEVTAYKQYLLEHDFTYSANDNSYVRANSSYDTFDVVRFLNYGVYTNITIEQQSYSFTSWTNITSQLVDRGYDYDYYKDYIAFPIQEGNLYSLTECYEYSTSYRVNKSFDLEAYDALARSNPNFTSFYDDGNEIYYNFKNGYVRIYESQFYYSIYTYCNVPKPVEIPDYIVVGLGTTSIDITNEVSFYQFTATANGTYTIYSTGDYDPCAYFYDADGYQLTMCDDYEDYNFRMDVKLEAGQTYYIGVKLYGESSATVDLHIEQK